MKPPLSPIFIDGSNLIGKHQSGIAYATTNFIVSLATASVNKRRIVVILPIGGQPLPERLRSCPNITYRHIFMTARLLRLMCRLPVTLPLDMIFGKGLYIFPNYYNFTLLRSSSFTFIYDIAFQLYSQTLENKNQVFLSRHIHMWLKRTDKILTISEQSKAEIIDGLSVESDKVVVVPIPIFRSEFHHRDDTEHILKKYDIPKDYIVYLGNFEPRKNLEKLIEAFVNSKANRRGIHLVLVGASGWKGEGIVQSLSSAKRMQNLIYSPDEYIPDSDLPHVLSAARFLIQPSLHEGLGVAPIQAIACGTPIAVSDIPVMRETFGVIAHYFDPWDVLDITKTIDSMTKKVKVQVSKEDTDLFLEKFAPERFVDCILNITSSSKV